MKNILLTVVCALGLFVGADYAFSIPDVHVSYETDQCVSVINYDTALFSGGDYSCENMPSKYNHVWVQ